VRIVEFDEFNLCLFGSHDITSERLSLELSPVEGEERLGSESDWLVLVKEVQQVSVRVLSEGALRSNKVKVDRACLAPFKVEVRELTSDRRVYFVRRHQSSARNWGLRFLRVQLL
jgi:hypothetical protein